MKKILFEDNFEYQGKPDPQKWNHEIGGHGWGNRELQYYTNSIENSYVKDGILTIKVKKEHFDKNEYTSAKLTTYKKQSFKYGSFRVCCKLPRELGLWPAIWLLPNSYKEGKYWPECGEIDIFEMVTRESGRMVYSLHTKNGNFRLGNQLSKVVYTKANEKFSEYRMDWTKDYFEYFIDGESVAKLERPKDANLDNWPFDNEFYLIINVASGGEWCLNPKEDFIEDKMEIKYVKVLEM